MTPHQSGAEVFLDQARAVIGSNLENEQFGVSELARAMGMSRSNLHRRIHSSTGKSVSRFMREVRLSKALELLKDSELTVSEVAYRVGFGSATYFSKCFHDHFGYTPGVASEMEKDQSTDEIQDLHIAAPHRGKRKHVLKWIIPIIVLCLATLVVVITLKPLDILLKQKDTVVAILPFKNDSPDHENDYIMNGLMEEILNKLSKIDGLAVVSRTTMELYRESDKNIRQISREVGADYILEGSATILKDQSRIRIQLIAAHTDAHVWSEPYDRKISMENIFEIQEEIAEVVAHGLDLVRDPEINQKIKKRPTEIPEAYESFLEARNLININQIKFDQEHENRTLRAKSLLERAIILDSTFSGAYTELGNIFISNLFESEVSKDLGKAYAFLDTGLMFVDKAIYYLVKENKGKRPAENYYRYALGLKARCCYLRGEPDMAERYYKESRKGIQRTYSEYFGEIIWYSLSNDLYSVIENYLKYDALKPENIVVPWWLHEYMFFKFKMAGFRELARDQSEDWLLLDGDSARHYGRMTNLEMFSGNYPRALENVKRLMEVAPDQILAMISLGRIHLYMREFDTAERIILEMIDQLEEKGMKIPESWLIGYIFQRLGKVELAEPLIRNGLEYHLQRLQYPIVNTQKGYNPFNVARIYSIMGNKEKTLEYLLYLNDIPGVDYFFIHELKNWPTFDLIRDTPEYKEILANLERRYQKEHERIERLLKKEGYI